MKLPKTIGMALEAISTGRTAFLPCLCSIKENNENYQKFKNKLKNNENIRCDLKLCPYQIFDDYLCAIPDPYGTQCEKDKKFKANLDSLKLCRALTTGSNKIFTTLPLGINNIRKCQQNLMERLPIDMQVILFIYYISKNKTIINKF
jgi:hypothetical protein